MASRPSQPPRRIPQIAREYQTHQETQSPQEAQLSSHLAASTPESSNPAFILNNLQTPASSSASQAQEQPTPATPPAEDTPEIPTCWICQQDATDDTPETSIWRRPCPCSLTAHDECLLEWITSQEAPKPGEMATTKQIVCPVCQAPIKIERPRDLLVMIADFIQKCAKTLVVPSALSALIGCFYSGFLVYGVNTMYIVFGQVEARRLLMPSSQELRARAMIEDSGFARAILKFLKLSDPFLPTMPGRLKLFLGLPMIAPALVLSRTKLADQIFAMLPISYFVFNPTRRLDLTAWPPSPALTLAVLPYIRTTYNELYKHTFTELEKQWDTAVQRKPREGETAEQIAAEQRGERDQAGFFDIEVELVEEGEVMPEDVEQAANAVAGEGGDQEAVVGGPVAQALREQLQLQRNAENNEAADQQPNHPLDQDEVQEVADLLREGQRDIEALRDQLQQVQNAADEAQAAAGGPRRRAGRNNGWEIRQNVSTAQVASTVMGALFFPAISSIMGDLLKVALPAKWVTKGPRQWGVKVSGGLLKEKWGRSIIGGCLFVVLKDAITLYCKWKKARDFGKKRVLDYVGERRQAGA